MSIHFKRSYINRNPPLLKIPNYYSPIQHSQTSNNRFHSNIKIFNNEIKKEQNLNIGIFYNKKPTEYLRTEPNQDIISQLKHVPSNRYRIPVITRQDPSAFSSNVRLLTNINHRKSFSDGNDVMSITIVSSNEKEIKKDNTNNYLSPKHNININCNRNISRVFSGNKKGNKVQKTNIKLTNYVNFSERNVIPLSTDNNITSKNILAMSQPLTNISTRESNSTASLKRKNIKIKKTCTLSFTENIESPEDIHFMIVSTIQRGKHLLKQFEC